MSNILSWLGALLPGLLVSVELCVALVAVGIPLGLIFALGLTHRHRVVRIAALITVEGCRGIPSLVMLYVVYFGLPQLDLVLEAFPSATIAFGITLGGYLADVFRSGFDAVPQGQREAAAALGLGRVSAFFRVILPQASRIVAPPVLGYVISYFQATSLAFAISVPELMSRAYTVASANFRFLEVLLLAGALYAIICIPSERLVDRIGSGRDSPRRTPGMV